MFWWTLIFSASCCFVQLTTAQIVYRGKCPTPKIQEDFNATSFSGRWYEDARSFALFQLSLRCVETDFQADADSKLSMRISGIDIIGGNRSYTGKLEIRNTSEPARMKTRFRFLPMSMNYIVLHTDYDKTAVIWSCHNLFGGRLGHLENLWVLSRDPKLPPHVKHELYDLLDERGVKRQFLQGTDQNDCPRDHPTRVKTGVNATQAVEIVQLGNQTDLENQPVYLTPTVVEKSPVLKETSVTNSSTTEVPQTESNNSE